MRDFDEAKAADREFRVGGKVLRWKYLKPEVLQELAESFNDSDEKADVKSQWVKVDGQVTAFLENDSRQTWKELRARDDDPVTSVQIREIIEWLIEVQTSRPTVTPSPSVSGRGETAVTSKAA